MRKGTTNVSGDWTGGLQEPSGLTCPRGASAPPADYRRCHGESSSAHAKRNEVGYESLCMDARLASSEDTARARFRSRYATGCIPNGYAALSPRFWEQSAPSGVQPSTYRTKGSPREHGNLDPSAGRSEARQATKSSVVSDEGRSLRSSPSAGEPRTRRREAVDANSAKVAGESHVCGVRA